MRTRVGHMRRNSEAILGKTKDYKGHVKVMLHPNED